MVDKLCQTFGMQNAMKSGLWECGNRRTFAPRKHYKQNIVLIKGKRSFQYEEETIHFRSPCGSSNIDRVHSLLK
jgi:hypothetical protein